MYKGIYIALSGGELKQMQMETIAQNLANANTPGYKKEKISFKSLMVSQMNGSPDPQDGRSMSELSSAGYDLSEGTVFKTGNPIDIALEGKGFISLENGTYTRRGDFKLDEKGYLATRTGVRVLGDKGPIKIPEGKIVINGSGEISVNDNQVAKLKIVDFGSGAVIDKAGGDAFTSDAAPVASGAVVKQGYVESSNVDVVTEMVRMIDSLREFESYQKVVQTLDDATSRVNSEMGKI